MRNPRNLKGGPSSIISSISTTNSRETNEYPLKYYTLEQLVLRKLSGSLQKFSRGESNSIDYDLYYKLGLDITDDQLYAWKNTSRQYLYFRNKKFLDDKIFSNLRYRIQLVIDGLYRGAIILEDNENLQTTIANYESILNDPAKIIEYFNNRYKSNSLSELDATVQLNVVPIVLPQYSLYIERFGFPDNGIYESSKLSIILRELIAKGVEIQYPNQLISLDLNTGEIVPLYQIQNLGFIEATWNINNNAPPSGKNRIFIGNTLKFDNNERWKKVDNEREIKYQFSAVTNEICVFKIGIEDYLLTNNNPSLYQKGINFFVNDSNGKTVRIFIKATQEEIGTLEHYSDNTLLTSIQLQDNNDNRYNTFYIEFKINLKENTSQFQILNDRTETLQFTSQPKTIDLANITSIGFSVVSPIIDNWTNTENYVLLNEISLRYID